MISKSNKILIVEDDSTFAASVAGFIKKVGLEPVVVGKPDEALRAIESEKYAHVILDCLLPQMTGVELAKKIRGRWGPEATNIILMSGVFTEKQWVKDSLAEAQAQDFLKKPFDLNDLAGLISDTTDLNEGYIFKGLYSLFGRTKSSAREKRRIIESLDQIHCFDLPFVLSLLVEIKASGHLNIVNDKNEISGVSLVKGDICQVDIADAGSYLGRLLMNSGFVAPGDLEWALNVSSNRKIGARLIDNNLLSPHGFDEALKEQMNIRLSKIIHPADVKLNFVNSDVPVDSQTITAEEFNGYLHDWIASKITFDWLKAHYLKWGESTMKPGPAFEFSSELLSLPLLQAVPDLITYVKEGHRFTEIVSKCDAPEEQILKAVHFCICKGLLLFEEKVVKESDVDRLQRLQKIWTQMKTKNSLMIFEMMGGRRESKESEIHSLFADFKKILGPEPTAEGSNELHQVYSDIKKKAEEAYHLFLNKEELEAYEKQWDSHLATVRLKAQSEMEEVKKLLSMKQFKQALEILNRISESNQKPDFFQICQVWAKIGMAEGNKSVNVKKLVKELDLLMMQVPAEERFSSLVNFVQGLVMKVRGDIESARKQFEKTLSMDHNMIEARRELNLIKVSQVQKPPDWARGDVMEIAKYYLKKIK